MRFLRYLFLLVSVSFLTSCSSTPEPINWGKDMCAHCKMTIIDQKFGAEIFTKKGKTFKFDSAECMLAYLQNNNVEQEKVAQFLVVDAAKPSNIINAKNATYLITDKLPSPMGGNLSAYANKTDAQAQSVKYDGDLYDWNSVLNIFKK